MAYYPVQVEKIARRATRRSSAELGEDARARDATTPRSARSLDEFLEHGRAVRAERARAAAAGEAPDFMPLVRAWGGVTLVYRKRMVDSPRTG